MRVVALVLALALTSGCALRSRPPDLLPTADVDRLSQTATEMGKAVLASNLPAQEKAASLKAIVDSFERIVDDVRSLHELYLLSERQRGKAFGDWLITVLQFGAGVAAGRIR